MALTNTSKIDTGPVQRATGSLSGTYTAATVTSTTANAAIASGVMTLTLGFVPRYFKIINVTDRVTQEWHEGMNQGDFIETAANGTRTLETDDKVTITTSLGSGGSAGGGGTAPSSAAGVVTVTFDGGAVTDNDTAIWEAIG